MSNRSNKEKRPSKKPGESLPVESQAPARSFFEHLEGFWLHFDRFAWDIGGVVLLALTVLLLLGLAGLTHGKIILLLVNFLRKGLGAGSYLLCAFLVFAGIYCIRHQSGKPSSFSLKRILALEVASFAFLTLMAIFGGQSLLRAEKGMDGGVIGWGLYELIAILIPTPFSTILLMLLMVISLFLGLNGKKVILSLLDRWLRVEESTAETEVLLQNHSKLGVEGSGQGTEKKSEVADSQRRKRKRNQGRHTPQVETGAPAILRQRDERLPPLNLLVQEQKNHPDEVFIQETADLIEKTLADFGIPVTIIGYKIGPTVTQYAVEPGYIEKVGPDGTIDRQKVRVSQIQNLAKDLALALSAERLRIQAPVPGQSFIGIEVPNPHSTTVRLRQLLESDVFQRMSSSLAIVLGRDVSGQPVVADLARMPHMLIAGTTGSGKSVCIQALTTCLIMNNTPAELRLVMLDPKMVELVRFNGLPHLYGKVETEIQRMLGVLRWTLAEMDNRYRLFEDARARDLESYNRKMTRRKLEPLPRVVVLIDELADLMMTAPDQTEHSLIRLAQLARATGIHLVLATQRPSTDVVTGLIKANFPARAAFAVASSIDSRVILDVPGAEHLLGKGDMLFLNPESGTPIRAQGAMVTDLEIERVVGFWQKMIPARKAEEAPWEGVMDSDDEDSEPLIEQAIEIVRSSGRASTSLLQRRLRIGFPRAARLMDQLEEEGVVGPAKPGGREREVLLPENDEAGNDKGEDQES